MGNIYVIKKTVLIIFFTGIFPMNKREKIYKKDKKHGAIITILFRLREKV
jgi:hypothetical protein